LKVDPESMTLGEFYGLPEDAFETDPDMCSQVLSYTDGALQIDQYRGRFSLDSVHVRPMFQLINSGDGPHDACYVCNPVYGIYLEDIQRKHMIYEFWRNANKLGEYWTNRSEDEPSYERPHP